MPRAFRVQHGLAYEVKNYMLEVLDKHRDAAGEVVCTTLAEDAADEYDLYDLNIWGGESIPEWVFDLAYTVAEGGA